MAKKILILCALALFLTGCASMCNRDAAYSSGMNDAQQGRYMSSNYALFCPVPMRARLNRAYRNGYRDGAKGTRIIINEGGRHHYRHNRPHWR